MSAFCYYLAWEWVNIALEYTAVSWVKLPHLFWVVVGVNLVTHPLFSFLIVHVEGALGFVLACEAVIFFVEWGLMICFYGRRRWRRLGLVALLMNIASYGTGVLIEI